MNKNMNTIFYSRKKKITLTYDGISTEFTLVAPSARDKDMALSEAQREQARVVKVLMEEAENIKAIYLLQNQELLVSVILDAEEEKMREKAAMTLVDDMPNYEAKLSAKVNSLKDAQRSELMLMQKDKLADTIVQYEIGKQLQTVWVSTIFYAMLAQALCDTDGCRLFSSLTDMKTALPSEVISKLGEAFLEFLEERGNAQVFLKPHISNG